VSLFIITSAIDDCQERQKTRLQQDLSCVDWDIKSCLLTYTACMTLLNSDSEDCGGLLAGLMLVNIVLISLTSIRQTARCPIFGHVCSFAEYFISCIV